MIIAATTGTNKRVLDRAVRECGEELDACLSAAIDLVNANYAQRNMAGSMGWTVA